MRELKQLPPREVVDVSIDLPMAAYFPERYLPDMRTKIDLYRRLARVTVEGELDDLRGELADRFGAVPEPVEQLLELARLRIWAHRRRVEGVHLEGKYAVLTYSAGANLEELRFRSGGKLRVADERSAYLPLEGLPLNGQAGDVEAVLARLKSILRPREADS